MISKNTAGGFKPQLADTNTLSGPWLLTIIQAALKIVSLTCQPCGGTRRRLSACSIRQPFDLLSRSLICLHEPSQWFPAEILLTAPGESANANRPCTPGYLTSCWDHRSGRCSIHTRCNIHSWQLQQIICVYHQLPEPGHQSVCLTFTWDLVHLPLIIPSCNQPEMQAGRIRFLGNIRLLRRHLICLQLPA